MILLTNPPVKPIATTINFVQKGHSKSKIDSRRFLNQIKFDIRSFPALTSSRVFSINT